MKVWITRSSAISVQSGGLERLFVWFRKPVWITVWRSAQDDDNPFGELSDMNGRSYNTWEIRDNNTLWISHYTSFGKLFGYGDRKDENENEIAKYVWDELKKHFKNEDFDKWHILEKEDKVHRKDFLLEIDLKIKM